MTCEKIACIKLGKDQCSPDIRLTRDSPVGCDPIVVARSRVANSRWDARSVKHSGQVAGLGVGNIPICNLE